MVSLATSHPVDWDCSKGPFTKYEVDRVEDNEVMRVVLAAMATGSP